MAKAAKEIQMENPGEAETPSAGATSEEQAEKPSMLCFKKRKKSCKTGPTVKDACEGALEEKSQCVSADHGEAKVSHQSRSSKGAWAAIKNLARPRRRQKSSSRKKVPSDSQVQLETEAEETCTQSLPKKRASSGVKMPCVRFSRGKKKLSPSEAVEESEESVQANEVGAGLSKASEEPQDLATGDKSESFSPVSTEEEQDAGKESTDSAEKSEPLAEPTPDVEERTEPTTPSETTQSETVKETAQEEVQEGSPPQTTVPTETAQEEVQEGSPPQTTVPTETAQEEVQEGSPPQTTVPMETAQEEVQEGSPPQTTVPMEDGDVAPEAPLSTDQPDSTPKTPQVQEPPDTCKELPEGDDSGKSTDVPEESKAGETLTDLSPSVGLKDTAASVEGGPSHQVTSEATVSAGVSIVITITEAEDSDHTDSDQAYEPSPVLHRKKQKGNKKSSGSFDLGNKEGPEAGGGPQAEEKGPGNQGHRTGEQYELLLIETASSLVKAAIQSSIEQLVNEMALEQNKHNNFL
ncbi:PREDICTED: A-kinase anchor protein 5 [Calidris pugnax]|uniref:A-kinase anchor protein 5 n=1 Tax=Calidris pugnax TaxID=198806 RepID=UPI00071D6A92|nr:PREDICTED: A-kinase anchor protein 5 [Calidris pugnax]